MLPRRRPEFFFVEIHGQLLQPPQYPHPHTVWAPFYVLVAPCPRPEAVTFSVTFTAVQGTLRPGQAQLIAGSVGCVPIYPTSFCEGRAFEQLDTTIHLTPAR